MLISSFYILLLILLPPHKGRLVIHFPLIFLIFYIQINWSLFCKLFVILHIKLLIILYLPLVLLLLIGYYILFFLFFLVQSFLFVLFLFIVHFLLISHLFLFFPYLFQPFSFIIRVFLILITILARYTLNILVILLPIIIFLWVYIILTHFLLFIHLILPTLHQLLVLFKLRHDGSYFLESVIKLQQKYVTLKYALQQRKYLKMERHQKRVYLDINYVFGSNSYLNLKNSISFIEQQQKLKLIYTAGKTIVKKLIDSDQDQMQFIKLSDNIQSIQCIAISPTRNHIAICQKIYNQTFILLNLYGLKTRDSQIKHFKLPQTQKQSTFKIIAFAPSQSKYACCLTGQPQNQLIFLDISRSRGLAVSNFAVIGASSLAINPTQSHIISICGKGFFKLYKVEDYSFKATEDIKKLPKNRNFTIHSWFDKTKILTGTDRGQLFMIGPVGNNYEVKRNFSNVFNESQIELSITQIGVLSKGFILGSNQGHFSLWIKKEENQENFQDQYAGQLVKTWKTPERWASEVTCIAICPKQQNVAVGLKNNSIALLKMSQLMGQKDQTITDQQLFSFMHEGYHQGPITYMDVCLHRPIIATLSKSQKCIRLWNYKQPGCELTKKFDSKVDGIEEFSTNDLLTCLALHPFGYYMAVGFCDKMRIYHILLSELRSYKEIVLRGICQMKFSNGGHLLAVAYAKQKYNIHLINVYNSYTLQQIARLSDHSNIITELSWKPDDRALYSVGADGFIIQWKYQPKTQNKQWQCRKWSLPNAKYTSGIYERGAKSFLASGQQAGKNVVRQFRLEKEQAPKLSLMGFRIAKLHWLNSQWNIPAILGGTQQGAIKVFNSPFDSIVEQTLNVHLKQITKILSSPCGRYVFSVGQDNNIFIYQVSLTNREGFISKRLHDQVNQYQLNPLVGVLDDELSDIILIQRNNVNERLRYIKMLEKNLQQMRNKIVMQDDQSEKRHRLQIAKLENVLNQKIEQLSTQFQNFKKEKKQLQLQTQTNFMDIQGLNTKMLEQVQALYEKKLTLENQKYFQLEKDYQTLKRDNQFQIMNFQKDIGTSLLQLKNDFIQTFKQAEKVHIGKQNQMVEGQKRYSEKLDQIQSQHEQQLKKIHRKINQVLRQKDIKNGEFLTSIQSYNRETKMIKEQIVDLMSKNDRIDKYIADSKKQLQNILKEIKDKSDQLVEKQEQMKMREEKIGQYQQRIGDLQKKKQILSYRTWQMRQQVEPKQDEIQFLKQELFSLENEFQNLLRDEKNLKETEVLILRDKEKLNKRIKQLKNNLKEKELKVKRICDEINQIIQNKNNDRQFQQEKMNELYKKYTHLMTNNTKINQNTKGNEEMARHIDHLKNQIVDVSDKTSKGIIKRDYDLREATIENKRLILQLSQLRSTKQKLSDQLKNVTKIAENLKRQINQIKNNNPRGESSLKNSLSYKASIKQLSSLPILNKGLSRSASGPSIRGKIARGNNFDGDKLINITKTKVLQLEQKLENSRMQFRQRQISLQMIKSIINDHVSEQRCSDPYFERCLNEYEL